MVYKVFKEKLVVLFERLQFLYLENLCNVTQIVDNKKEWGQISTSLKEMQKVLWEDMKGDFNPKSPENAKVFENMIDNQLCSMESLEENHVVLYPLENFCIGNISSINYFLGTNYQQDSVFLHDVFDYYKEPIAAALVVMEDKKIASSPPKKSETNLKSPDIPDMVKKDLFPEFAGI